MRRKIRTLAFAVALLAGAGWASAGWARCRVEQILELPVTMKGLRPTVTAKINGKAATFVIDSGAFYSVINTASAKRLDLPTIMTGGQVTGVAGSAYADLTTVKRFEIVGVAIPDLQFIVTPATGAEFDGLLGQNFLGLGDVEYDLANGVVRLFRSENCAKDFLGYWSDGKAAVVRLVHSAKRDDRDPSGDRDVRAVGAVNGKKVLITLDTGARQSMLTLPAAAKAGLTSSTAGALYIGQTGGIGSRSIEAWRVPVDSFAIGAEEIRHTDLDIAGIELPRSDMLLGTDFFLSHRVYVANSQGLIYLTYNGGPVFRFDDVNVAAMAKASPGPEGAAQPDSKPTAEALIRRAAASASRLDYDGAIKDLDQAIAQDPAAEAYFQRFQLHVAKGQQQLAQADLDQALKLKPGFPDALMVKAAGLMDSNPAAARDAIEAAVRLEAQSPTIRIVAGHALRGPLPVRGRDPRARSLDGQQPPIQEPGPGAQPEMLGQGGARQEPGQGPGGLQRRGGPGARSRPSGQPGAGATGPRRTRPGDRRL